MRYRKIQYYFKYIDVLELFIKILVSKKNKI